MGMGLTGPLAAGDRTAVRAAITTIIVITGGAAITTRPPCRITDSKITITMIAEQPRLSPVTKAEPA
jgi:hypothetical protein